MKPSKLRLAPKVASPNKKKPNFMREYDNTSKGKGPFSPMSRKRLSK